MNKKTLLRGALWTLIAGTMTFNGCSCSDKKGNPIGPGGQDPTLYGIVINNDDIYANSRNVKLKLDFKDADQVELTGDVSSPSGYSAINADSTIDAVLTSGDGVKSVGARVKNSSGESDVLYDSISLDLTGPSGLDSLKDITSKNNRFSFNLNLSDIDSGSYSLSGATTGQGNLSSIDSLVFNEGTTNLKVYARDVAGNDTSYTVLINASKIRNEQEGLDSTLKSLSSLGYVVSDSSQQIGVPTRDNNTIYLTTDKSVRKNAGEELFVIYDAAGSMDSAALDAVKYFNETMGLRNIPRRIVCLGPSFGNEISDKVKSEISIFEASLK